MNPSEFKNGMIASFLICQAYLEEWMSPICKDSGITLQQFHILVELDRGPGRKAGDLSDMVGVQRGNMAGICKKMEQNKWIERKRTAQDERVVLITITEDGRWIKEEVEKKIEEKMEAVFSDEPEETFDCIFKGMDCLGRLMEKLGK